MSEFVTKKEEEENKTYFVGPELRGRRRRENGWLMQDFPSQFGKSGQDQTRLGFPKFVTENGWLLGDFPSRIWEDGFLKNTTSAIYGTGSDTIRASQIRDGKWLAVGGFSVTNLGKLNRIRHDVEGGSISVAEGHIWGPKAPQLAKRACPPRRGLEGEPRSGSNF